MLPRRSWLVFFATGCYSGQCPVAPGTAGTLAGLLLCWGISNLPDAVGWAVILWFIPLAAWIADRARAELGQQDPPAIVIDEMAGMLITLGGVPFTFSTALLGTVLFRIFDIAKPFPIGWLDRRIKGGWGIVLDDVAAGLISNLLLRGVMGWIWPAD